MPRIGAAGGRKDGEGQGFSTNPEHVRRRAIEQAVGAYLSRRQVERHDAAETDVNSSENGYDAEINHNQGE